MSIEPLPSEVATELLQASSEATIVADADGRIVFVNREAEILFGYGADEMLDHHVEMLMPEAYRERRPIVAGIDMYGRRKYGEQFNA
jgi:PAS domain S-box-containing protein